ncbi:J domain-containing protein [Cuniculiplasma sp. SKW4]|uniref:J domain-containing protein n=1 Tax=Cuniculiplasma sp. SKW4 TaxID=3400171 RepID=UPI003FD1A08F
MERNDASFFNRIKTAEVDKDRISIDIDLSQFRDNKLRESIFMYWLEDESVKFDGKTLESAMVNGILLVRKNLYRGGIFNNYGKIKLFFKRQKFMNSFGFLIFYQGKTKSDGFFFTYVDETEKRFVRKGKINLLNNVIQNLGIPLTVRSLSIFYESSNINFWDELKIEETGNEKNILEKRYFEILEMDVTDDFEIIRKKYRDLVKRYHPDLGSEDERKSRELKMQEINEAYEYFEGKFEKY